MRCCNPDATGAAGRFLRHFRSDYQDKQENDEMPSLCKSGCKYLYAHSVTPLLYTFRNSHRSQSIIGSLSHFHFGQSASTSPAWMQSGSSQSAQKLGRVHSLKSIICHLLVRFWPCEWHEILYQIFRQHLWFVCSISDKTFAIFHIFD